MKKRNHDRALEKPGTARTGRLGYGRESLMSFKKKKVKNGFICITESKTDERREIPVNDDVATMFKEIRREQGLSSPYVFLYASLKEVQELLGHKDIKMTMRYAHLAQENKKIALNLLNGFANVTKVSQIQNQPSNPLLSLAKF